MEIKGIAHVSFKVSNMKKTLDFYCGVMKFKQKFELNDTDGKPWIVYIEVAKKQYVELFYDYNNMKSENSFSKMGEKIGYMHLSLEVTGINDLYDYLKTKDVKILTPVKLGSDNTYQFWIEDPDGNPIEFHEYTDKSFQIVD